MRSAESAPSLARTSQKTLCAQGVDPHTAVGAPSWAARRASCLLSSANSAESSVLAELSLRVLEWALQEHKHEERRGQPADSLTRRCRV